MRAVWSLPALKGAAWDPESAVRNELAAELSRRDVIRRAGVLGLGAAIASALPLADLARPAPAFAQDVSLDGTLQAFFDTIIPGRVVERTVSGGAVHPGAIAGVDPEPGAVEADALKLGNHPLIGFTALAPVLFADLQARSLLEGGTFLDLDYDGRERVCVDGLDYANPDRVIWEAGAAVPFTAFCAAATMVSPTRNEAPGYRVMGHGGAAPGGYRNFSYRRRLNRGRTRKGYLD
jgi:hypothetical protein